MKWYMWASALFFAIAALNSSAAYRESHPVTKRANAIVTVICMWGSMALFGWFMSHLR